MIAYKMLKLLEIILEFCPRRQSTHFKELFLHYRGDRVQSDPIALQSLIFCLISAFDVTRSLCAKLS